MATGVLVTVGAGTAVGVAGGSGVAVDGSLVGLLGAVATCCGGAVGVGVAVCTGSEQAVRISAVRIAAMNRTLVMPLFAPCFDGSNGIRAGWSGLFSTFRIEMETGAVVSCFGHGCETRLVGTELEPNDYFRVGSSRLARGGCQRGRYLKSPSLA